MTERGKHHGQRLKAKEVLRLYAAGERDFRGAILRGCNFRGADLSGGDFSGADIRSAQFVAANLQKANFSQARAGLRRPWVLARLVLVVLIAVLAGVLQGYSGALVGLMLTVRETIDQLAAIAGLSLVIVSFFAIARQGFTIRAFGSVAFAFAGVVGVTAAIVGATAFSSTSSFSFIVIFTSSVAFAVAFAGTVGVAFAFAVAFTFAVTGVVAGADAFAFPVVVASAVTVAVAAAVGGVVGGAFVFAVAVAGLFLSLHINRRIRRDDPKFENLRIIGLAFATLGGTAFSGADFTDATFAQAHLKSTNFANSRQCSTRLTRVRWHQAQKLDLARLGSSNLRDPRVRKLVTTLNGVDQDLSAADLRGTNLAGAKLHRAHLEGVNLNGATLAGAELHRANLTEAQCLQTDFTQADLTGACIEAWNIDSTTCLENVQCEYIYLLSDGQERRPNSGSFKPGEFTKLFQEVLDTIDLIFQNGIDWKVFVRTFDQIQVRYGDADLSVQSIENKGDGVVVVKLNAAPGTDKSAVHQTVMEGYQVALKEAEARYKAQLDARDEQITDYRQQNANMHEVVKLLASRPVTVDLNASGSTINLGEISGQVSNQINQLPDTAPDQPNLKDLLTQLQAAVEADTELSAVEKKEALGEVAKLAEAGSQPKAGTMQRMAKRATAALKSITKPLSDASKLATACKNLLPLILSVF